MIIEQLSICAPKGQRQAIGSALATLIGPTQVQSGCLKCRLLQGWQEPDELVVEANWGYRRGFDPPSPIGHLQAASAADGT